MVVYATFNTKFTTADLSYKMGSGSLELITSLFQFTRNHQVRDAKPSLNPYQTQT
jgi:hypothetical protein